MSHPLTEKLRPHVGRIQSAAMAGDDGAAEVIRLYQMWVACPGDRCAPTLCELWFDRWLAGNPEPN